jgi:hypothetical protein
MTTRQRLFALAVLASLPATGLAAPAADPAARRAQIVTSAEKGTSFQAGRQTYRVVVVKLAPGADAQALAQANGLAVDHVAVGIGYAYLRVPDGRDVVAAAAALARDKRARAAYPEIRETFPSPN